MVLCMLATSSDLTLSFWQKIWVRPSKALGSFTMISIAWKWSGTSSLDALHQAKWAAILLIAMVGSLLSLILMSMAALNSR